VLAILGLSPVGNLLIIPLENRFPPWEAARGAPDGIIVLGGVIDASSPGNQIMLNESAERLTVVPDLARRYPNARILFSGGSGALIGDGGAEAGAAARLLESLGISLDRVILEDRSRNTVENAVYSKLIVHPKRGERWLLVTSAFHIPRAIGVFRKVGFPVEPYPVDWAHTWCGRYDVPICGYERRAAAKRHCRARVGRPPGLLAHQAQLRAVSGANSRRPLKE